MTLRLRGDPQVMRIVHVAARVYEKCRVTSISRRGGIAGDGCRGVVFDGLGRGSQQLDKTTPGHYQGLERLPALLMFRVLAPLCGSRISRIIGR